jgi:hypothetical protein
VLFEAWTGVLEVEDVVVADSWSCMLDVVDGDAASESGVESSVRNSTTKVVKWPVIVVARRGVIVCV